MRRRRFRPEPGLLVGLALLGVPSVRAGTIQGEVGVEVEYLGESFFSEQRFTAEELDLPEDSPLVFTDTTRFDDDTWLPGQRVELWWRDRGERFRISSSTGFNRERFRQDLRLSGDLPAAGGGSWRLRGVGSFREESRSLTGTGDWSAIVEAGRERPLGSGEGALRGIWERSRSRGDTTTYLFDFDLFRLRASAATGGGWLPGWDGYLEGAWKRVPHARPGSYRELRGGGVWRPGGGIRHSVTLDSRWRDYGEDDEGMGRDFASGEVQWRSRLAGAGRTSWNLETIVLVTDYRGEDELYYDAADATLFVSWRRETGPWTVSLGPAARGLADLGGGDRDFRQWSLRSGVGRLVGLGGFGEINVEGGYRDYASDVPEVIQITSLSSSLLRSDYWLVDLLAVVNVPVGLGLTVDLLATSSWEVHAAESERIQVAFVTLGVSRRF